MIGNDMTHIDEWISTKGRRLERYAKKVLTVAEWQSWITKPTVQHLMIFWVLKEAAYKAISRKDKIRRFSPKRYEILKSKTVENQYDVTDLNDQSQWRGLLYEHQSVIYSNVYSVNKKEDIHYINELCDNRNSDRHLSNLLSSGAIVSKDRWGHPWLNHNNLTRPMSITHAAGFTLITFQTGAQLT